MWLWIWISHFKLNLQKCPYLVLINTVALLSQWIPTLSFQVCFISIALPVLLLEYEEKEASPLTSVLRWLHNNVLHCLTLQQLHKSASYPPPESEEGKLVYCSSPLITSLIFMLSYWVKGVSNQNQIINSFRCNFKMSAIKEKTGPLTTTGKLSIC